MSQFPSIILWLKQLWIKNKNKFNLASKLKRSHKHIFFVCSIFVLMYNSALNSYIFIILRLLIHKISFWNIFSIKTLNDMPQIWWHQFFNWINFSDFYLFFALDVITSNKYIAISMHAWYNQLSYKIRFRANLTVILHTSISNAQPIAAKP